MTQFYTLDDFVKNKYDDSYRSLGLNAKDKQGFYKWQSEVRDGLKKILGLDNMQPVSLEPKLLESKKCDGYRRDKVIINTQKDVCMPMYVLVSDNSNGMPVIAVHGHGSNGKNGLVGEIPDKFKEKFLSYNYSYALELVKRGYVVFCPDLAGSGERRQQREQSDEDLMKSSCVDLNNALISVGMSLQGMIVYDLIRLLDYIERCSECTTKEAICCGFSGGAYSTWWLSALEDRVSMAIGSGFFHGFKDTILYNNRCSCNFVPRLWEYIDMGDLVALSAPKPIFIEVGKNDGLNGHKMLENVYPQLDIVNDAYNIFDKNIELNIGEGAHKWFGLCYDFIDKNK